jgi:hypothetical protein
MEEEEPKSILTLAARAALFDTKSAFELSKLTNPHFLWSLKLTTTSFYLGFIHGAYKEFLPTLYRFNLENLHRMPITRLGNYEFYKQRNYTITRKVIKHGILNSFKLATSTFVYCASEYLFIEFGEDNPLLECSGAGLVTSILYGISAGFKKRDFRVFCLTGLATGAGIGAVQKYYKECYGVSIKTFT